MEKRKRLWTMGAILFMTVAADQITKLWAKQFLRFRPPSSYFFDTFRLLYTENPGAFLSLGAGLSEGARFWIFTVAVGIGIVAATWYFFRHKMETITMVSYSLILGGGIGNFIDRATYGRVVDFMNMGIGSLRTGIFNIADFAIVVGGVLMLYASFTEKNHQTKT